MSGAGEGYSSFLLRLERIRRDGDEVTWTARIQCTATGELRCFGNLDVLIGFLRDEFGAGERTEKRLP